MELVVDTNILYTFFWKDSLAKRVLMRMGLELFSPEFALEEINAHESDILKKTGLSLEEFVLLRKDIAIAVGFIPIEEYREFLSEALSIVPDSNDVDFLALALKLKLKLPLWSNDALLKKQNSVRVFSTSDLLHKPEFRDAIFPDE